MPLVNIVGYVCRNCWDEFKDRPTADAHRSAFGHNRSLGPIIRCGSSSCGRRHIACVRFTNACECGADYGLNGNLLAPRSQWGEETGESVADILAVDTF